MFMLSIKMKTINYLSQVLPTSKHQELWAKNVLYFSLLASLYVLLNDLFLFLDCGVSPSFLDGVTPVSLFGNWGSNGKNEAAPVPNPLAVPLANNGKGEAAPLPNRFYTAEDVVRFGWADNLREADRYIEKNKPQSNPTVSCSVEEASRPAVTDVATALARRNLPVVRPNTAAVQHNLPPVRPNTAAVQHNLPVAPNNAADYDVDKHNYMADVFEHLGRSVGENIHIQRLPAKESVLNRPQPELDQVLIAAANKVESPRNVGAVGQSFSNSNGFLSPPNRLNSQQLFSPPHGALQPRPMSPPSQRNSEPLYSPRNLNNAGEAANAAPAINNNQAAMAELAANVNNNQAAMAELAANVNNINAAMAANVNAIARVANNINAGVLVNRYGMLRHRFGVPQARLNQNNAGGAANAAPVVNGNNAGGAANAAPAGNGNNVPNDGNAYPVDDDHAWPVEETDLWDFLPAYRGVANVAPARNGNNAGGAANAAPVENLVNVRGYRFVEPQLKWPRCFKGPGEPGEPFDPGTNSKLQQVLPKKELPQGNGLSQVTQGDEAIAQYSLLGFCVLCFLSFIGGLWFIMYSAVALTPFYNIIKDFLNKKVKK